MNTLFIENYNPIVSALKQVIFELFGIRKEVGILLPESSPEEIGCLVKKSSKDNFVVVYFNFLKDTEQDKWIRDTYRFWCGFFERLGVGYEGSDVIRLVKQLHSDLKDDGNGGKLDNWYLKLHKLIDKHSDKPADKTTTQLIMDKGYSFARVSHNSKDPEKNAKKLSYLITALRESVLWGFSPANKLKILIIDDRLYEYQSEKNGKNKIKDDIVALLKICKELPIECYGLIKNGDTEFQVAIEKLIDSIENGDSELSFLCKKIVLNNSDFKPNDNDLKSCNCLSFDYLLVDLWYKDTESIRGLSLISELHHKLQEIARKGKLSYDKTRDDEGKPTTSEKKLPEILAYSVSDDAETIQMAHRMGAAGYITKKIPESLVLAIVRAGLPLGQRKATLFDFLISNSFPIITRVPRQITKNLFSEEIKGPDTDGQIKSNSHLEWLRKIPKSDLHVHFGTAIPIEWCYILSLISLIHWNDYWKCINKVSKYKKILTGITDIVDRLSKVITGTLHKFNADGFRRTFLREFSVEFKIAEVVLLKDVITYLTKIHSGLLTEKQIACLINVLLGNIIFDNKKWGELYKNACKRIEHLKKAVGKEGKKQIHNLKLFRDCRYLIDSIHLSETLPQLTFLKLEKINGTIVDFDPLSEMLATDIVEHPYGLERYLAASDLVGSSLLQFTDTLLLASMSIPEWAAALKANETSEANKKNGNRDNVIHIELRATPQGFLRPYDFDMQDRTLAAKLICAGLEFGIKILLKKPGSVSANLLLSIKRDRDRSSIMNLISIAVDMRDEYMRYLEINKDISEVEGYMIPHVSGLDVAGIERNNLPADLQPYYREAFERCLLSTIHAGETESSRSVRDAIFMLSASRIGHGLSIKKDAELKKMISDRGICVELCPKSNQFTNGFPVFSAQRKDTQKEDKDKNNSPYEYVYTDFRGKLIMTINTDNPTISHKASNYLTFAYPLSEEFIWLAGMINDKEQILLSRLEALHLIYNGFTSMFAPEQAKKYIIGLADDEILSLLAEEYLDIDMRIGNEK